MQVFTFYELNQNKFTIDSDDLKDKYLRWLSEHDWDWLQQNRSTLTLRFIANEDGLNSVALDTRAVGDFLDPIMIKFLNN